MVAKYKWISTLEVNKYTEIKSNEDKQISFQWKDLIAMDRSKDINGESGVVAYVFESNYIKLEFSSGKVSIYS